MKIIPVIDVLDGIVVRGIAGRRNEYRAIQSAIVDNADPIQTAYAFQASFGLTELYIADLDAILHHRPNWPIYQQLAQAGFHLLSDIGVRDVAVAGRAIDAGIDRVIAALETSAGPAQLQSICDHIGSERIVFSLDIQDDRPMGDLEKWETSDPFQIACTAVECGIEQIIVLDLAGVGVGGGVPTVALCRRLLGQFPHLQVITGGGVSGVDDLVALKKTGIAGVLIASALHNGKLSCGDLDVLK